MTITGTGIVKARSPKYPSRPLDWAVNSALNILEQQGSHALPMDVVANSLGYKDSGSGPARQSIATLKSYGMLDKEGSKLRLSQSVQGYKLSPTQDGKNAILQQWLLNPPLFSELLTKHGPSLPSNEVLIHDLVLENRFTEKAARKVVSNLRGSIEFANYEEYAAEQSIEQITAPSDDEEEIISPTTTSRLQPTPQPHGAAAVRYPVRLAGGRMAYIEVPDKFYNKDKAKLEAQLSIIGTLDEDTELEELIEIV